MTQSRAFLIDVDNTLIDAEKIKSSWKNHFGPAFSTAYKKAKTGGFLNIGTLAKNLSVNPEYFYNTPFKKFLFERVLTNLSLIKKTGKIIIVSLGDANYQKRKINISGIDKIAGTKNIKILQNKKQGIIKALEEIKKQNFNQVIMIDDISANLEAAYRANPKIINIWIRYGKHKNKYSVIKNAITMEVPSFSDAANYILRLLDVIHPPKSGLKLSILKGIDQNRIEQLVKITKIDHKVSKCTHDIERFKSVRSVSAWKSRGKIIYTLIDKNGKLKGIVWFGKKTYKKYNYTMAIRTYKPVRGKGIAKKFMDIAIKDFLLQKKNAIWLETSKDNIPALNLYKSYGFKIKEVSPDKSVIMTYGR